MDHHQFADRFKRYADTLAQESDRGSVIVGAAILEDVVEQVLVARLMPALEKEDELLAGSSAPCGTFSAKIDLAYRIGSIGLVQRSSLHLIRKMRNDAAHAQDQRDLSTPQLQHRLRELLRLNATPAKALWDMARKIDSVKEVLEARASPPAAPLDDLVSTLGWRLVWNMLVAGLATGMSFLPDGESRLHLQGTPSKNGQSA